MADHREPPPGVGSATAPDRQVLRAVREGLLEVDDKGSSPAPQSLPPQSLPPQSLPPQLRTTAGTSRPAPGGTLTARRRRSG